MNSRQSDSGGVISRTEALNTISTEQLDVLVIGGGIVGSGIARDAAMRGLKTGLVEQYDIAYGTSSRSSRLLHGGIRYLAQGRVGLVHEASVEKSIISRIAPHVSDPLPFLFPTYKCPPWGQWALWKLMIGVKIYDFLCGGRNLGKSSWFSPKGLLKVLPGINPNKLTGAVRYFDGLTNDSRLVIDTLRSASNAGAIILNYCRAAEPQMQDGLWHCTVTDTLTGRAYTITSKTVVNSTGPWAEHFDQSSVKLRPTKGVHLVISRDRLPSDDAVVMVEDTRILFAIPWGERMILGTTDTDYSGKIEDVKVEPEDVDYILDVVNASFPSAKLNKADIISSWAGLRPLICNGKGGPSDISRSHEIKMPEPGWLDISGGKLTTYRLMAQQSVDKLESYLGRGKTKCHTADEPLLNADEAAKSSGIIPLEPSKELVEHYCKNEWAIHLDDIMNRRTSWTHYRTDAEEIAQKVADWMAEIFDWDNNRKAEELLNAAHSQLKTDN